MAFRSQTQRILILSLAALPLAAQTHEFHVRHQHWRGGCTGLLRIGAEGVSYQRTGGKGKDHHFRWNLAAIQQLELVRDRVIVTSYRDRALLFGSERPFEFRFLGTPDPLPVYETLSATMDQRFVARIGAEPQTPLWRIPVKRLRAIRGVEGELVVELSRVLFLAASTGESRVWRDSDIDNISSSGPFSLSIVTFERGGVFEFQLREALHQEDYEELWKRLNRQKGLQLISTQKENFE